MPRRRTDKPIEKLRAAWTSTDDLEASMALMFHPAEQPASPANLSSADRVSSDDKLAPNETSSSILNLQVTETEAVDVDLASHDKLTSDANVSPTDSLASHVSLASDDTLSGDSSDRSHDNLAREAPAVTPDSLSGVTTDTTLEKLSGARGTYEDLDGNPVDARYIRRRTRVQDAHTGSEHLVYQAMWAEAGKRDPHREVRDCVLEMRQLSRATGLSQRNVVRVVHSLERKKAIEVLELEDATAKIGRKYRIYSMIRILDRCRASGFEFVYRYKNTVELVRPTPANPTSPVNLPAHDTLPSHDSLASAASLSRDAKLTREPPDNLQAMPPDNLSGSLASTSEINIKETSSPAIVRAINEHFGYVDDDAIRRIIASCRHRIPDATDDEIATFTAITARRIRRMNGVTNPVGLLITQVPKCFEGDSFRQFRAAEEQRREAEEHQREEWRREAQAILDDPNSQADEKEWALAALEGG
jgi:hypothetical protein